MIVERLFSVQLTSRTVETKTEASSAENAFHNPSQAIKMNLPSNERKINPLCETRKAQHQVATVKPQLDRMEMCSGASVICPCLPEHPRFRS